MDEELKNYLQEMENRINKRFDKIDHRLDMVDKRLDYLRNGLSRVEYKLRVIDDEITDIRLNKNNLRSRYELCTDESILLQIQNLQEIQAIHTTQIAEIMRKLDL